jgi:hypothetical protein
MFLALFTRARVRPVDDRQTPQNRPLLFAAMRLDAAFRIPRLSFIDRRFDTLRAMVFDRRLANPENSAHVREELSLDG